MLLLLSYCCLTTTHINQSFVARFVRRLAQSWSLRAANSLLLLGFAYRLLNKLSWAGPFPRHEQGQSVSLLFSSPPGLCPISNACILFRIQHHHRPPNRPKKKLTAMEGSAACATAARVRRRGSPRPGAPRPPRAASAGQAPWGAYPRGAGGRSRRSLGHHNLGPGGRPSPPPRCRGRCSPRCSRAPACRRAAVAWGRRGRRTWGRRRSRRRGGRRSMAAAGGAVGGSWRTRAGRARTRTARLLVWFDWKVKNEVSKSSKRWRYIRSFYPCPSPSPHLLHTGAAPPASCQGCRGSQSADRAPAGSAASVAPTIHRRRRRSASVRPCQGSRRRRRQSPSRPKGPWGWAWRWGGSPWPRPRPRPRGGPSP